MSSSGIAMVTFADMLVDFWYVFVVLVILVSFGIAAFSGQRRASTLPVSPKSEP
jgi:hypothetical protein